MTERERSYLRRELEILISDIDNPRDSSFSPTSDTPLSYSSVSSIESNTKYIRERMTPSPTSDPLVI
jgi:hypothetical protein